MSFWDGANWVDHARSAQPTTTMEAPWRPARIALSLTVAALIALPISQAFAGWGGSSVWIEGGATSRAGTAVVGYGDAFGVGYQTRERKPWAHAVCYANGSTRYNEAYADGSIWGMYYSVYSGGPQPQDFVAGLSVDGNWSGGGADCRLDLLKFSNDYTRATVLASTSFTVSG